MNLARVLLRGFHTSSSRFLKKVEEVNIPVPWGHIAGKWWGRRDVEPILAVHGWQDNANSWDPLCEVLPEEVSVLAIDLPGNGLSSHLPPLQNYYYSDAVGCLRRIRNTLGLGPIKLLGHSGGSSVCFLYAAVFPEDVHSYFGIDYVANVYVDEERRAATLGGDIDKKIELGMRDPEDSRKYTWQEAKDIWIKATNNSLDEKSSDILMKRGVKTASDGKVYFCRDHRLKTLDLNIYNPDQVTKFAENIQCHVHLVKGLKSPFMGRSLENLPNLFDLIRKNAKSFKYTELDGKHHLHMDIPEQFVPLILDLVKQA